METNTIAGINIVGRRWFQRTYGNTYHRADVFVTYADGSSDVYVTDKAYGYGEQYLETARDLLAAKGTLEVREARYGRETMREVARRMGITLSYRAIDVPRERDL